MIKYRSEEEAFDFICSIRGHLLLPQLSYLPNDLLNADNLRITLCTFFNKEITLYSLLRDESVYTKLNRYYGLNKQHGKYILTYRSIVYILEYYGVLDNLPEVEEEIIEQDVTLSSTHVLNELRKRYNNLLDIVIELRSKKNELELEINELENKSDSLLNSIKTLETVL